MAVRDDIILRSGIFYFVVVIMALAIVTRIVVLQNFQKGKWAAMGEMYVYKTDDVPANRGDILTYDGRLLASSVPYYSIYMDTRSTGMSSEVWDQGIDGLSSGLSRIIGERSAEGWKSFLVSARRNGERYLLIKRRVSYETLRRLKELPVFREGQYKGGMVAQAENRRIKPNSDLAARTIGYINQGMDRKFVTRECFAVFIVFI